MTFYRNDGIQHFKTSISNLFNFASYDRLSILEGAVGGLNSSDKMRLCCCIHLCLKSLAPPFTVLMLH